MRLFDHPEFDDHEKVLFGHDHATGLKAIIAIHDTTRGLAVATVPALRAVDGRSPRSSETHRGDVRGFARAPASHRRRRSVHGPRHSA